MSEKEYPDKIITETEFWWKEIEQDEWELFSRKEAYYVYDPYLIKFEEPNLPNMFRIKTITHYDVLLGNYPLVDAGLHLEYQIDGRTIENLQTELRAVGLDTHERFLRIFRQYCESGKIPSIFEPQYDHEVGVRKILSLLQTESGL